VRRGEPAGDEAAAHADVDHVADVPGLFPELTRGGKRIRDGAGIVDQDIDAALLGYDLLDHRSDLIVVGMVTTDRDAVAPDLGHFPGGRMDRAGHLGIAVLLRPAGDIDRATVRTERTGDAPAGTAAGAGNDCDGTILRHRRSLSSR